MNLTDTTPLLTHLREEFQEIIKSCKAGNTDRVDWLARKAIEHIDRAINNPAPTGSTPTPQQMLRMVLNHFEELSTLDDLSRLEQLERWHTDKETLRRTAETIASPA